MNVNGSNSVSPQSASPPARPESERTELGQQDFLKLMTTQLRNQDPMNPMKNGDFMAQMAQFTTATGVQELQRSFSELQSAMTGNQSLQAAGLVGRRVSAESDSGYLPDDGELTGSVALDAPVDNLTVAIADATGTRIAEIALGAQSTGSVDFTWDGENADGERMPSGDYRVLAETRSTNGVTSQPVRIAGEVTSVALTGDGGPAKLTVEGLGEIAFSDVRKIHQ